MQTLALTGLLKIELPAATIRLCDGGFVVFDGETYTSKDATFGTVASLQALTEGVGEEIPALELSFNIPGTTAFGDLAKPGFQKSAVRLWIGEYDVDSGTLVGEPDLLFFGQPDQPKARVGKVVREWAMTIVSALERLFMRNEGNTLSPAFHKSVWPGETGHDNATGLTVPVAWGVESSGGAYGGGAGFGGGSQYRMPMMSERAPT
jgi:hypothetical protein